MTDVTRTLSRIERGDPSAAEQLLPLLYNELRKLAAKLAKEGPGQSLRPTTEAAHTLGISVRTAERTWTYAKAWLLKTIQGDD